MDYKDIKFKSGDSNEYSLNDFHGTGLVLYFYPKDNTPGCTTEAIQFTSLKDDFAKKGYKLVGVSRDSVASHCNFTEKHNLGITLLSDPDGILAEAFGVLKDKTMFGRQYKGIVRSTFIINKEGDLIKEYRNVSPFGHAANVLADL